MRLVVIGLVALAFAGTASAAGPPTGQPLAPPFKLPWPAPGVVKFVTVTVSGTLKAGASPTLTPIMYGRPPSNARVAGGKMKPVTARGKTSVKFYFAIKNVSSARRLAGALAPAPQVDFLGIPANWTDLNVSVPVIVTCLQIKAVLIHMVQLYDLFSFGDTPEEMWQGALHYCG